jgi:hypothetical protein
MNASPHLTSTQPPVTPVILPELPLPRAAMDELYSFLQYLQFKYQTDLEAGAIPWSQVKQELGLA